MLSDIRIGLSCDNEQFRDGGAGGDGGARGGGGGASGGSYILIQIHREHQINLDVSINSGICSNGDIYI